MVLLRRCELFVMVHWIPAVSWPLISQTAFADKQMIGLTPNLLCAPLLDSHGWFNFWSFHPYFLQLPGIWVVMYFSLMWRHNGCNGVSNHQPYDCLRNRPFRQIKENIKAPRHWPLCGEFTSDRSIPRTFKWTATRKMFPFDDVISLSLWCRIAHRRWAYTVRDVEELVNACWVCSVNCVSKM